MATTAKSPARVKAEKQFYALIDSFDESKYNSNAYKKTFDKMSDAEFKAFMKRILNEEEYICFEVDTVKDKYTLKKIFDVCEKNGYRTHKYVKYRDNVSASNPNAASVTPYPTLILYVNISRLQQMVSTKNSISGNIDCINTLTGTVTGSSKSASLTDAQTYGLITTGQKNILAELLGPRADEYSAKLQMLRDIEEHNEVSIKDLDIKTERKQSVQTMTAFLKAALIDVKIKKEEVA